MRIERNISAACFEYGQQPDDHALGRLDHQGDPVVGTDPMILDEPAGQGLGARIELTVRQAARAKDDGLGIGRPGDLFLEEIDDGLAGVECHRGRIECTR